MAWPAPLLAADRAALQHLGGPVRYTPLVGPPVDLVGVFDAAYVLAEAGGRVGVTSSLPAVFVRLEDLPLNPDEDQPTITVAGVAYKIHEVQRDGQGGALLLLHRE